MLHTYSFHMHFSNFGLPELNRTALANEATVSGHCTVSFLYHNRLGICRYRAMLQNVSCDTEVQICM